MLIEIRQFVSQAKTTMSRIYFCAIFHADQAKQLSSWIYVNGITIGASFKPLHNRKVSSSYTNGSIIVNVQ